MGSVSFCKRSGRQAAKAQTRRNILQTVWKTGKKVKFANGLEDRLRWGRQAGELVASHTKYNEPPRRISGASENGGYLLLYSPTTCSTIGVAELGVWCGMVWCARRRGRRRCSPSAVPWAAYKRHSRSQSFHTRTRQSFLSVCRTVHSTLRHTNPCLALTVRATRLARACLRLCALTPAHPHA